MSKKIIDSVKIENGKYELVLAEDGFVVNRYDELWMDFPVPGAKMLIVMMYEIQDARKLLAETSFDFDPEKVLGPACGPEMLQKIKDHAEQYGWKLEEEL